jgi:hypothetical protein
MVVGEDVRRQSVLKMEAVGSLEIYKFNEATRSHVTGDNIRYNEIQERY